MNQSFFAPSLSIFRLKQFNLVSVIVTFLLLPSAALAAGNVLVNVQNGNLVIQGDAGDNNIIVVESGVVGRAGTTVNGERGLFFIDGVTNDVRIAMMGGNDFLRVELPGTNFAISNNLVIRMGAGDDNIELLQTRAPNQTEIHTGDGNDIVFIDGVTRFSQFFRSDFFGKFVLRTGSGNDLFEFHNATFHGEVDVVLGTGNDGACTTQDSEFVMPNLASFDGGGPSGFLGDGFVSPSLEFTALLGFEFFPDDCSFLGGRF
jgi:hypothetical protein